MKNYIVCIALLLGCGPTGKKLASSALDWSTTKLESSIKRGAKKSSMDSLHVKSPLITLTVAIPYSDTVYFRIKYTTQQRVYLADAKRNREMYFRARDSSFSVLKKKNFLAYGPH
jgi:hypothetical protein